MMKEIIDHFGGRVEFRNLMGVTNGAVTQWLSGDLPFNRMLQIEELSGGEFKAVELNRWAENERSRKVS